MLCGSGGVAGRLRDQCASLATAAAAATGEAYRMTGKPAPRQASEEARGILAPLAEFGGPPAEWKRGVCEAAAAAYAAGAPLACS